MGLQTPSQKTCKKRTESMTPSENLKTREGQGGGREGGLPPSVAPEPHPAVPVRRTGAQDRRQAGRGGGRDQPRHRRPRPPDSGADRRGDAGGRHRARDPPLPLQPRPRRLPRGGERLLRAALRRGARPRERDHPRDRRQGGDLQPQPRLPRPRRRRARLGPRLPRLQRRAAARRRRPRAAARSCPSSASSPTSTRSPPRTSRARS